MTLGAFERLHAIVSVGASACLAVVGSIALRRPFGGPRRAPLFACLVLIVLAGATGFALEEPYRNGLRQRLFLESRPLALLFERKEHVAFGAVAFAVCGLASALAADRCAGPPSDSLARAGRLATVVSAVLAVAACVASAFVGAHARLGS